MSQKIIDNVKPELDKTIEFYVSELKNVRTGRATPALVEDLKVEYYGSIVPMKQIASISAADARTVVISPWDRNSLAAIEKAIKDSELGLNPNNDGNLVRLSLPPLTEDRRKDLVKVLGKKTEEIRIRIRKTREQAWSDIQDSEKNGEISEDDKFRLKDKLQELIDQYNKKVEEIEAKKEKDIMEI